MTRCLITGANGFIGRALREYLDKASRGLEVFGMDVLAKRGTPVSPCQLTDAKAVRRLLCRLRPQLIIHLAGGTHADPRTVYDNNFVTTKTLLNAISTLGAETRIVLMGSAAEYGLLPEGRNAYRETSVLRPRNWYGYVKSMQTSLGEAYAREGLDVMTARLFNICGKGLPESLVLGKVARQLADIEKRQNSGVLQTGPLGGQRDFLDIQDICSAILSLIRKGKRGQVYNVCRGRSVMVRSAVHQLIRMSKVTRVRVKEETGKAWHSRGSCAKIRRVTGWQPRVAFEQSLKNTLNDYRSFTGEH